MHARIIMTMLLSVVIISASAQTNREVVNQSIEWFSLTNTIKLNKRFSIMAEGQFRYAQNFEPMQMQARTALDIKVNEHFSFVPLGYVYTWNHHYGKQPASTLNDEHRIWQQVMYKHKLGGAKFDHRLRFEERFIENHHVVDGEGTIVNDGYTNHQFRIRYRFMARVPLNKPAIDPKTLFASVYDEIFMSWGKKVTYHKPDQNRAFAGLGYQVTKDFSVQTGFLYQMLVKSNGAKQENNFGLQMMVNYTIDLAK